MNAGVRGPDGEFARDADQLVEVDAVRPLQVPSRHARPVSGGTFTISRAIRYMANGDWVAVELEFQARREGARMAQQGIDLLRVVDGRIVEARLFSSDQDEEDAFWGL